MSNPHFQPASSGLVILRDAKLSGQEVEDLRAEVGWDRMTGQYDRILDQAYAHFTVHTEERLVGFLDVISDGIADAFLVDLVVHPDFQHRGVGKALVRSAVLSLTADGIRMIQVVFEPELEAFYRACGFTIIRAGLIDTWE